MIQTETVTQQRLRELLWYCPATGIFEWKRSAKGRKMGRPAGCKSAVGYIVIRIDGVLYQAHRLAFLYIYGRWPNGDIDHKDGVRTNNALDNIRECSRSTNLHNRMVGKGRSGLIGASWCEQAGRWHARIQEGGRQRHIGTFPTAELAHAAYMEARRAAHGDPVS